MIIGLTGNMGAGKSLAAAYLAELGAAIIDADAIGHQVLEAGGAANQAVITAFGASFADAAGNIDRRALGAHVFADSSGRRRELLNSITHPAIRDVILRRINELTAAGVQVIVVEAALLLTSPLLELVDRVWVITAGRDTLLNRVASRDKLPREQVEQRLAAQLSPQEMVMRADRAFVNDRDAEALRRQIGEAYAELGLRMEN